MKTTNKQIAQIFRNAIPFLNVQRGDGKTKFICHAIRDGYLGGWSPGLDDNAIDIITDRLGEDKFGYSHTVESWLVDQGIPEEDMTWENVQKHRHAWLNLLIEEFENKD